MPTSTIIMIVVFMLFVVGYVIYMRKAGGGGAKAAAGRLGGAEAATVEADFKQGKMDAMKELLARYHQGAWDDRDFFVFVLARQAPLEACEAWCQQEPESAAAHLVRGARLIEWAWEARGRGTSDKVSDNAHDLFHQRLQDADRELSQAAKLDPADPTPWAHRITVARGLGQETGYSTQLYQEAAKRYPQHQLAHLEMLTNLTEKWGGSHQAMFDFAKKAAKRAGEGSDLGVLVLYAHIERWLYFSFDDDDKGAKRYLKEKAHQEECVSWYQRSLGSPQLQSRRSTILARNAAAMWFFLARDRRRLQSEVAQIGNAYTDRPWGYWDEPERAYAAAAQYAYRG